MTGFNPAPARSSDSERRPPRRTEGSEARPARPPESRHAGDSSRDSRSAERGARPAFGPGARREKADPWFLKPYEPAKAAAPAAASMAPVAAKPKQKVAALLGGLLKQ